MLSLSTVHRSFSVHTPGPWIHGCAQICYFLLIHPLQVQNCSGFLVFQVQDSGGRSLAQDSLCSKFRIESDFRFWGFKILGILDWNKCLQGRATAAKILLDLKSCRWRSDQESIRSDQESAADG